MNNDKPWNFSILIRIMLFCFLIIFSLQLPLLSSLSPFFLLLFLIFLYFLPCHLFLYDGKKFKCFFLHEMLLVFYLSIYNSGHSLRHRKDCNSVSTTFALIYRKYEKSSWFICKLSLQVIIY